MEIVKRLEGPEEQDSFEYDIEEDEYYQDAQEKKLNKTRKPILLPLVSLLAILLIGYFGFKIFSERKMPSAEINRLATIEESIKKSPIVKPQKEPKTNSAVVHKTTKVVSHKEVSKPLNQVVIYTEELAQELKPKKEEVIKELIVTHETPPKKIATTTPMKKTLPPKIVSIQATPKKPVAPKEQVLVPKVVSKKPVVKKVVIKKPVIKKPKKQKTKVAKRKQRIVTIKKGDTLALISQKYYGNAMEFKRIIRANKRLKSSKTALKLGEKIIVPYPPKNKQRRFVIVKKGYSLAYISKKFYGTISEVQRIVDANPEIKNKKSTLHIGQKVYVPR